MLKYVIMNQKRIPVPVPLLTIHEAVVFVSDNLLSHEHLITQVRLDGQDLNLDDLASEAVDEKLSAQSRLEFRVDSPYELVIQSVDALRNLAHVLLAELKTIVVGNWSGVTTSEFKNKNLNFEEDLELLQQMLIQVSALAKSYDLPASISTDLEYQISADMASYRCARAASDRKSLAKILLNNIEPLITNLIQETVTVQSQLFQQKASHINQSYKSI
jgi:hypothetical protein